MSVTPDGLALNGPLGVVPLVWRALLFDLLVFCRKHTLVVRFLVQ